MRILACGGRDYLNVKRIHEALSAVHRKHGISVLIHGAAAGADTIAGHWALLHGIDVEEYPADWERYGRRAGPIRNRQMVKLGRPDAVVAFRGGPGTADMVVHALACGLKVWQVDGKL